MPGVDFERSIQPALEKTLAVRGDFAELGVYRGDTFLKMIPFALMADKTVHAVDSFCGMAAPTVLDAGPTGKQQYPEGRYDVGGSSGLCRRISEYANARIWEGFVPGILDVIASARPRLKFAFVHVDLDHYLPTLAAMQWCWQRMSTGGILMSHDWRPSRDNLASLGIQEFMECERIRPTGEIREDAHVWFEKGTGR